MFPGEVGDERERPAAGDGAALVGEHPAHADGGLQLGAGPLQVPGADREDAELVVEVRLLGDVPGQPGGLLPGAQGPLPGAPVQSGGEGGRGGAGEEDGGGPALSIGVGSGAGRGDECCEGGEQGVGLGGGALGGDGGVAGPPGVVLGGAVDAVAGLALVPVGEELGEDSGGEPVAGADRGEQAAGHELAEGGVGVGVADERRQVGLVRELSAEGDGEAEGGLGGAAQAGGEEGGGCGALTEAGQGYLAQFDVGVVDPVEGRGGDGGGRRGVGRPEGLFEGAEGVELGRGDAQSVALAQQRPGLDEAQRQALGLEPEVAGPVGLLVGEGAADGALQELEGGAAAEAGEGDLLHVGVGRGRGRVGARGEEEGALGGRGEELVEGGAAELQVVDDDDGADVTEPVEESGPVGPVVRGVPDGGEELVEEFGGGAVVAGEADDAVGGELRAVGGDRVEEGGAAGSRGAGQARGAAAGEGHGELLALLLAFEQGQRGGGGTGRYGRGGGAGGLGALLGGAAAGGRGLLARRAGFDLAAVDGVDGEEQLAGDEPDDAGAGRGRGGALGQRGAECGAGVLALGAVTVLL